ncbi:hypothetical protein ASPCADRAFT_209668 [Aspergillus carbonarius ITEM 5010]|uniref:Uncharacterized protein n=1 Tax=Aspergillus carbonarius (strain ITEM 5010) TaxID=602072 RepID=A0A1R3REX7_ASPC5|nr:hypothetical protein ASPCADRAFT_209668 [Aspergillus carbonarius ITEM 5010]
MQLPAPCASLGSLYWFLRRVWGRADMPIQTTKAQASVKSYLHNRSSVGSYQRRLLVGSTEYCLDIYLTVADNEPCQLSQTAQPFWIAILGTLRQMNLVFNRNNPPLMDSQPWN